MRGLVMALVMAVAVGGGASGSPRSDKERAKVLYREGLKLYAAGGFFAAKAQFDQALQLVDDPAFLFNLGQRARSLGDHSGAVEMYKRFLKRQPEAPNRSRVEEYIAAEEQLMNGAPPPAKVAAANACPDGKAAT